MKQRIRLFALFLLLCLIFSGCVPTPEVPAEPSPESPPPATPADPPSTNENNSNKNSGEDNVPQIRIVFEHSPSHNQATITAYNEADEEVWNYITPEYEQTELERVSEIGQKGDIYYFVEGGTIEALEAQTGALVWSNSDFQGAGVISEFGEDGIYLCGFYSPDFFAVGYDGKTLARIEQFDPDYFWPGSIELIGDCAAVTLTGSMVGDPDTQKLFYVDLSTYAVSETMP